MNKQPISDEHFRGLFDAAPDATLAVDSAGLIVLANMQAAHLFGYRQDELVGRPVEDLLPDVLRDAHVRHRADYEANPRTRLMGSGLNLYAQHSDGRGLPVDISLSHSTVGGQPLTTAAIRLRQGEVNQAAAFEATVRTTAWQSIRGKVLVIALIDVFFTLSVSLAATSISGDQACSGMQRLAGIQAAQLAQQKKSTTRTELHQLFPTVPAAQLTRLLAQSEQQQERSIQSLQQLAQASCRTLF